MIMNSIAAGWQVSCQRPQFRVRFFTTIPFLALTLIALATFFRWVELLTKKFDPAIRSY
jgi:hypothetical protein